MKLVYRLIFLAFLFTKSAHCCKSSSSNAEQEALTTTTTATTTTNPTVTKISSTDTPAADVQVEEGSSSNFDPGAGDSNSVRGTSLSVHSASKAAQVVSDTALRVAKDSLTRYNTTYDRCQYIRREMETRYGAKWFCGSGKTWSARYQYSRGNMIVLVARGRDYTAYLQIFQEQCTNRRTVKSPTLNSNGQLNGLQVGSDSDRDLGDAKTQAIAEIVNSAIRQESSPGKICDAARQQLQSKFGGHWTVAAGEIMALAFSYEKPYYIRFIRDSSFAVAAFMQPYC